MPSIPMPPSPPLFSWLEHRAAGVLLHPTSFPGPGGIGTLDSAADDFLGFLSRAGIRYWQTCPLGPTGFGDSPYQTFSSFAGNPYLIDLEPLLQAGLLSPADLSRLHRLPTEHVDFGTLYQVKLPLLFTAHANWHRHQHRFLPYGDFQEFCSRQAGWLETFTLFSALKDHHDGRPWWEWPREFRTHSSARKSALRQALSARAEGYAFQQYLFFGQWRQVRAKAAAAGVEIIGDIPIFTALDSADVWGAPHLFQLDPESLRPTAVAGVPPDYFSADGQLWGNPLYAWARHAADGYAWWLSRLEAAFALCDVVRIDHFRGFEAYWSVPAGAPNARRGQWLPGPGLDFFRSVRAKIPHARLIAEDLGLLTPATVALREATGLPGMAVLQFAFGGDARNLYLPHNLHANCVLYPGTHDNDTTRGWYATADEGTRDHVRRYLRISGQEISWDFVRAAYASVAGLIVVPLPDLLSLGSEARFNTPGQAQGNWTWRYRADQLHHLAEHSAPYLLELAALYRRERAVSPGAEKQ